MCDNGPLRVKIHVCFLRLEVIYCTCALNSLPTDNVHVHVHTPYMRHGVRLHEPIGICMWDLVHHAPPLVHGFYFF